MRLFTLGYVHRGGRTLMLRRTKKPNDVHVGKWVGLGGKMEEGESPSEGIIREVYEESGLIVTAPTLKSIVSIANFKDGETWHMFVYLIESFAGELLPECAEWELAWIDDSELMGLPLWPADRIFMPALHEEGIFEWVFRYRDGEMESYEFTRID